MKPLLFLFFMGLLTSCSLVAGETTELRVEQAVEIEFFDTDAGIPEQAVVVFDELTTDSSYQSSVGDLLCAELDLHASHIKITVFETENETIPLEMTLELASVGLNNWRTLATFEGSIQADAVIPLSDNQFTLDDKGVDTLTDFLLSAAPSYRVRITAKTTEDTQNLSIELSLDSLLGSDENLCVTQPTIPATGKSIVLRHGVTVDFDTMDTGQAEEASIFLGDLREDAAFAAIQANLVCAQLDIDTSSVEVFNLSGVVENMTLNVAMRQQGSSEWFTLATFQGSLDAESYLRFSEPSFFLPQEGANTLGALAASQAPIFDLRIEATSNTDLEDLEVDVIVGLRFGTDENACASSP